MEQHLEPFEPGDLSKKIGINTPVNHDKLLNTVTKSYIKILRTPKQLLKECFPVKRGMHVFNIYTTLMFIMVNSHSTIGYISIQTGSNPDTLVGYMDELLRLEYVKIVKRRTFVIPFNAYRQDKTFVITVKGSIVLNRLINY